MTTDDYSRARELLRERAYRPPGDPRRTILRDEAIVACLPLARHIAQRYRERGEPFDDLEQVARLGLVHAVDRFDPTQGNDFLSFAVPTIIGEVRRHFRDRTASIRLPRSAIELRGRIREAEEQLEQTHGRTPDDDEIAAFLGESPDAIVRARAADIAQSAVSLDAGAGDDERALLLELLGADDPGYARVERCLALRPAVLRLPERDRTIIGMRFYEQRTQSDIACRMGISQMHVSRLLAASLGQLRAQLT
ncbi:SigB/SigF/SigG family RNA polymerase sigma factor [Gordonia neofelifaecis]|uniref:Putative sigma factor n=1 Tax=Gordonia neofelifaecis NRRL B-59395 TaxID=644548 RepID=F1YPQ4_9ACTN|nr:SigB/SigF/SigG family RNA polymerase sigma factor [Gordonia neofelifaecis]EGD53333.1 putative sigma factor [Gordonia neofelifaecis NRRL B-59395]